MKIRRRGTELVRLAKKQSNTRQGQNVGFQKTKKKTVHYALGNHWVRTMH